MIDLRLFRELKYLKQCYEAIYATAGSHWPGTIVRWENFSDLHNAFNIKANSDDDLREIYRALVSERAYLIKYAKENTGFSEESARWMVSKYEKIIRELVKIMRRHEIEIEPTKKEELKKD